MSNDMSIDLLADIFNTSQKQTPADIERAAGDVLDDILLNTQNAQAELTVQQEFDLERQANLDEKAVQLSEMIEAQNRDDEAEAAYKADQGPRGQEYEPEDFSNNVVSLSSRRNGTGHYTDSPQCKLLATHCLICGLPLVDAKSVECGMGPVCRKNCGYEAAIKNMPEAVRTEGNALIHQATLNRGSYAILKECFNRLNELGFEAVVYVLMKAVTTIKVHVHRESNTYWVETPYAEAAIADWRRIPGRRFKKEGKAKYNTVPVNQQRALFGLLKNHYAGHMGMSEKGLFLL